MDRIMMKTAALLLAGLALQADEPRAARSVHFGWKAPESALFYNEMTVLESTPGSYFMACGWSTGYFGVQELGNGKKIAIFSVWDTSKGDDPKAVPGEKRVEVLESHPDGKASRFGGEGTGAKCMLPFEWEKGKFCRFLVKAVPADGKTTYAAWIAAGAGEWKKLAVYRAPNGGVPLKGLYSFVEDFRRDGKSLKEPRRAAYGNGWARSTKGEWIPLLQGRFTADGTPVKNFDGALVDGRFELATGGGTANATALNTALTLPDPGRKPPEGLPEEALRP
jgi:hypothetical protein